MSRSERYISPSDAGLQRLQESVELRKQFDRQREELLRKALFERDKEELVEITLHVARKTTASAWSLEQEVELVKPTDLLVRDIRVAIDIATQVDEQRLNCNFDFDYGAYEAVRWGLLQLTRMNEIGEAKGLALNLMQQGSFQMECSDEGMMKGEIERCLRVVISAVAKAPIDRVWAKRMLDYDRIGCLCEPELTEMIG